MPRYDFHCPQCDTTEERIVALADLNAVQVCPCGAGMERLFPVEAAYGFREWKPFYCEPLDCDVHGRREWNEILRAEGIQEAAQPAGKRLEEKSKFANRILPQKPIGRRYADVQRQREHNDRVGKEIERRFSPEGVG